MGSLRKAASTFILTSSIPQSPLENQFKGLLLHLIPKGVNKEL
jgi:hypothetical protein